MSGQPFQWSVFRAALDRAVGSEQAGSRPVLVVSSELLNEVLPIVTVLPLTSLRPGRHIYPTEVRLPAGIAGQPAESLVLAHQIRTIAKQRLAGVVGRLEDSALRSDVRAAMRLHLDLEETA